MQRNLTIKNPYEPCDAYEVYAFETKVDWKQGRKDLKGIGGSDSAAAMGESKWRNNRDLWLIKTGRKESPEIGDNPAVRYGTLAEKMIREQFTLDNEDKYVVFYKENCILKSKRIPCMLYSPDGLLVEKSTGRKGVLEIKTATPATYISWQDWDGKIPQQYFVQVLHGMSVIQADFAVLRAYLRKDGGDAIVRNYVLERSDFQNDIEYIEKKIVEFWKCVETDKEPPLKISFKGLEI